MSARVTLINSLSGNGTQTINIGDNVALGDFLKGQGIPTEGVSIRVGRDVKPMDYALQNNDLVTVSPTQIKGA